MTLMTLEQIDDMARAGLLLLADAALRALIVAAIVGIALVVFRVTRASDRLSAWRFVVCAALVMPLAGAILPDLPLPVPAFSTVSRPQFQADSLPIAAASSGVIVAPAGAEPARALPIALIILSLYAAGVLLLAGRSARGWLMARRLDREAETIVNASVQALAATHAGLLGMKHAPRLAEALDLDVPVALGVTRPVVVLPTAWRSWSPAKLDAVLLHEISHVSRRDVLTRHLALALRVVSWPSPLGWWLNDRVTMLAEEASDEAALAAGVEPTRYADILLGFVVVVRNRPSRAAGHLAMARSGGAGRRVDRILEWHRTRSRPMLSKRVTALFVTSAALVVGLVSAVRPVEVTAASDVALPRLAPAIARPVAAPVPAEPADGALAEIAATMATRQAAVGVAQQPPPPMPPPPPPPPAAKSTGAPPPPPPPPQAQQQQAPPTPTPTPPPPPSSQKELMAKWEELAPKDDFAKGAFSWATPGLVAPQVLRDVKPKYTPDLMRAKAQGSVVLQLIVQADGSVSKARAVASDDRGFDDLAIAAALQWKFTPGTLSGRAVPVVAFLVLEFRLH